MILNVAGAQAARKAVETVVEKDPSRSRFVAGAMGPTNRTACMSPDVNNPAYRAVTYEQLREFVLRTGARPCGRRSGSHPCGNRV